MRTFETVKQIKACVLKRQKKVNLYPNSARYSSGVHILGQPGMGKTKLIESLVLQDIRAGQAGVGVIDVHGDLFRELTWYLAAMVTHQPELAQRVVIIDPTSEWTVSFNPLGAIAGFLTAKAANPRILTNSWGGDGPFPPLGPPDQFDIVWALEIRDAFDQGIFVVFSAGNGQFTIEPQVPGVLAAGKRRASLLRGRRAAAGGIALGQWRSDLSRVRDWLLGRRRFFLRL